MLLYTREAERLRETLRDVLGWDSVDGHDPPDGWLIFKLPPAEVAVHPAPASAHELYFMCDDLDGELRALREKGVAVSAVEEARWGSIAKLTLPGGGEVGLYQPSHPTALDL